MEKTSITKLERVAIIFILLFGAIMRLYKIDQYMTFLGDEGRDAIVMKDMVTLKHFPAIGPGTSIGNMYLGPLYYYLVAPSLLVFNLSPVGPAIFVSVIGLMTVGLIWWVGRQWFGRFPALAVATLYAVSQTVIIYSRSSWNPNVMPFFALPAMYGIWKVWRFGYWHWLLISAVSFAFVLNSHYLGLLLAPSICLFLFLSPNKLSNKKYLILGFVIWALLMSPLLFFDLRHNGQNFAAIKTFFTDRQTTVNFKAYKAIPNLWPIWQDMVTSLLAAKNLLIGQWTAVILALSTVFYLIRSKNRDFWFIASWLGFGLLGLGLYKQHIYDHYYGFLFPAVFLLVGYFLRGFKLNFILILPLIFINLQSNSFRYPPNNQLAHTRQIAEFIKSESADQPFNLALLAKTNYDAAYRYFLQLNEAPYFTIHQKITGQLFVICEIPDCQPIGNSLWEIASFGWAKIDGVWDFPWGVKLYRLVPNPSGKNET